MPITGNTMRPPVSIHTLARSAKAVVRERNTASARKGLSSGTVTSQKRRHALLLSSSAYSNSSGGMALMPGQQQHADEGAAAPDVEQHHGEEGPRAGAEGAVHRVLERAMKTA